MTETNEDNKSDSQIGSVGCPDKGTSVISLATYPATTTTTAAMFTNADDTLSN